MRWRTEREVIDGKGQFSCGNLHCDNTNTHELCSYEVPFRYKDLEGKVVSTLVKVRLCGPCAYSNERKFTSRLKLFHRKIREIESEHPEFRKKRKACETSQDVFDYITSILKEEGQVEETSTTPLAPSKDIAQNESKEISVPQTSVKRDADPIKETQKKQKKQKKPKTVNGHIHYSSSSDSSSEGDSESDSTEANASRMGNEPKREVDADGNEVISTSNDVWKTSVEVEHTENENMDDFINQLFLYSVSFKQREKRRFVKYTHRIVIITFFRILLESLCTLFS